MGTDRFRVEVPGDLKDQGPALMWTNVRLPSQPDQTDYGESITSIAFVVYQLRKPERD